MIGEYYILDEAGTPVATPWLEWNKWFAAYGEKRIVERDELWFEDYGVERDGGVLISTVFLGIDSVSAHSFNSDNKPVLWETRIFGGTHDRYQERYTSLLEAVIGHAKAVALARVGMPHGK